MSTSETMMPDVFPNSISRISLLLHHTPTQTQGCMKDAGWSDFHSLSIQQLIHFLTLSLPLSHVLSSFRLLCSFLKGW